MCLLTNNEKPLVAKEDIECYKMTIFSEEYGCFRTAIRRTQIPHEVRIGLQSFKPENDVESKEIIDEKSNYSNLGFKYMINDGYIHIFKDINEIYEVYGTHFKDLYIFKCVIPKGTQYYEGAFVFRDNWLEKTIKIGSYCAKEIVFKEMKIYDYNKNGNYIPDGIKSV